MEEQEEKEKKRGGREENVEQYKQRIHVLY